MCEGLRLFMGCQVRDSFMSENSVFRGVDNGRSESAEETQVGGGVDTLRDIRLKSLIFHAMVRSSKFAHIVRGCQRPFQTRYKVSRRRQNVKKGQATYHVV